MPKTTSGSGFIGWLGKIDLNQLTWGGWGGTISGVAAMAFKAPRWGVVLAVTIGFLIFLSVNLAYSAVKSRQARQKGERQETRSFLGTETEEKHREGRDKK